MKKKRTLRGFEYYEFESQRGEICSLQKSSSAMEDCIWIGPDTLRVSGFIPFGEPDSWTHLSIQDIKEMFGFQDVIGNQRMHLTRRQVKKLLPVLQKFADTGEL